MWYNNKTTSPLNCSCVPISPRFLLTFAPPSVSVRGDLLPSSFSLANLSGHNRPTSTAMLFLEWEPFSPACSPTWLTEINQGDTLLWQIYRPSFITTDLSFFLFGLRMLLVRTHQCGRCSITATQLLQDVEVSAGGEALSNFQTRLLLSQIDWFLHCKRPTELSGQSGA